MFKKFTNLIWMFFMIQLLLITPEVLAKKEEVPGGWLKGEKKGWQGQDVPPGLSKKEAEKVRKEAEKVRKEAEKATVLAQKKAKQVQKEVVKKAQQVEKRANVVHKKAVV